jgi:hypothetical protein
VVVEHRGEGERGVTTADLIVGETRRGVLAWLAAPGPMGSLEFVSPEAAMAAAFVVESPVAMVDDLAGLLGNGAGGALGDDGDLAAWEDETGIDLRDDLAAALGGEVAFALDGPLAPEPSWKLIVEVDDPALLQATLARAVARFNDEAAAEGGSLATLASYQAGGRTFYRLGFDEGEVHYVYVDGYLLAAPSQALLERTLAERAAGSSLPASADFRRLLPADGHTDFSAVFYQHFGPLLGPLAEGIGRLAGGAQAGGGDAGALTAEQLGALAELARDGGPTLACAYGEADRIRIAGTSPFGPFDLGGPGLFGLGALGGLAGLGEELAAAGTDR